jgi:imidazolonepropionase-like amidohydrolase
VNLRVIDASGKHVYPGLIGANTVTGLMEIGAVGVTVDVNEQGSITPEARAIASVNPDSTLIPVTRLAGVLTTGVMPSGGVVPGRAAVIRMDGWTWEDMAVEDDAGLIISWPRLRPIDAWWMDASPEEQQKEAMENRQNIIDLFDAADAYFAAREADPDGVPIDTRFEAMRPSMTGETPVFARAQELEQIQDAVSVLTGRGMNVVIVGGRDAPLCADLLSENGVAVMITGTHNLPDRRDADYDETFTLPKKLEGAGVRWCLATSGGTFQTPHERTLPHHAGTAVAYGLPYDAALRSITLSAAELLGVADKLGSIEPGKLATIIVTDGDPLELTTRVTQAFIDGREIDLRSKQTELYEKYREKYRQMGIIND